MLVLSENKIHIDHIIWQPRFSCTKNCDGCYIYENTHVHNPEYILNTSIIDLIKSQKVSCNQFTISLDYRSYNQTVDTKLINAIKSLVNDPNFYPKDKLCLSVDSLETLNNWIETFPESLCFLEDNVYMVSISGNKYDTCYRSFTDLWKDISLVSIDFEFKLNYNKLIANIEDVRSEDFEQGCKYVDHINLVLPKKALGRIANKHEIEKNIKLLKIAYITARAISKRDNVSLDVCYLEKIKNNKEACSAGISKITVWPDGSVTGCPYDVLHVCSKKQKAQYKEQDTLEEIYKVIDQNPFQHCKSL